MRQKKDNLSETKNIAIMGTSVDSGNRGVLALASSLIGLCDKISQGGRVILMLGHKDNCPVCFLVNGKPKMIDVVNCRRSPLARPCDHIVWIIIASIFYRLINIASLRKILVKTTPWIAALQYVDIVGDVRGGDSFSDIYGMERFLDGFFIAWSVILVKGTIVQFPQTFGPFKSELARILAGYILRRSHPIIARDKKSRNVAQKLIGKGLNVWISPDVAFSLEAVSPDPIEVKPKIEGVKLHKNWIGLNVNGLMYNGGYTRKNMFGLKLDYKGILPTLVSVLLSLYPGELWLVPHTYADSGSVESDPEACIKVYESLDMRLQKRVRIVTGKYDQHEIKGVIGQCEFFIGSRMHACIAAISQGVPCVAIAYSMKFEGVFDSIGMQNWVVDGRTMNNTEAVQKIVELFKTRDTVRDELKINAEISRDRLNEVFNRLASVTKR